MAEIFFFPLLWNVLRPLRIIYWCVAVVLTLRMGTTWFIDNENSFSCNPNIIFFPLNTKLYLSPTRCGYMWLNSWCLFPLRLQTSQPSPSYWEQIHSRVQRILQTHKATWDHQVTFDLKLSDLPTRSPINWG